MVLSPIRRVPSGVRGPDKRSVDSSRRVPSRWTVPLTNTPGRYSIRRIRMNGTLPPRLTDQRPPRSPPPCSLRSELANSAESDSRVTSSTVSCTALIARPRAPLTPGAARSSRNESGAGGRAPNSCTPPPRQRAGTLRPRMKRRAAAVEQLLKSAVSTEWPVFGMVRSWACGQSAAALRAVSLGVRRSISPDSISTGTSGSDPAGGPGAGAGEASGQRRHMRRKSLPSSVAASNG